MKRAILLFALLALSSGCRRHRGRAHASEQPGVAAALRDKAIAKSRAYAIVQSLVDEVGPRMSGSPGDARAVEWALRTMQSLGISKVRSEPVKVAHWERGEASASLLVDDKVVQPLMLAALGGSVGTSEGGIEAEVVRVESLEALDKLEADAVRGKIVFFDKRMERTPDGAGYGKAVDVRGKGPTAAAKKGAVAIVIRSVGTGDGRFPHTGATRYEGDVAKIPAAALAIPDAEILARTLGRGKAKLRMSLGCKMLPDATSANVIGEIEGSANPAEIVLIGAHLDSWDQGFGAIDDGAGVAIVLETARLLAELPRKPRRTVRVVLFANEEMGIAGAKEYAKVHAAEIDKHVLGLEADLGAGKPISLFYLAGENAGPLVTSIAQPILSLGIAPPKKDDRHGSDLWPLRNAGVPVADIGQDASHYFDVHHTADDTMLQIVPRELDQTVAATAAFVFGAADSTADFGRIPEAERKK
ncbi:MAG: M20/M25/M40 family metallo-hydrolase [Polyangiales bacterium]